MATRAQFSLRMLLGLTAVVAICVAPFIQPPSFYSATAMMGILFILPAVALCGVYGCRGASRFFFMGCLVPATAGLYLAAQYAMPTEWYRNIQGPLAAHWQVYFQSIAFPIRLATAFVLSATLLAGFAGLVSYWIIGPPANDEVRP